MSHSAFDAPFAAFRYTSGMNQNPIQPRNRRLNMPDDITMLVLKYADGESLENCAPHEK
jgi:hypothetical protein